MNPMDGMRSRRVGDEGRAPDHQIGQTPEARPNRLHPRRSCCRVLGDFVNGIFKNFTGRSSHPVQGASPLPSQVNVQQEEQLHPVQNALFPHAYALRHEMIDNVPKDQRDFLFGVSLDELQTIRNCYDHPLMEQVVNQVRSGQWESLIQLAKEQSHVIHSILKAAYCQGKLGDRDPSHEGIDNLASAYIFLGPALAGQNYTIYRFDEIVQDPEIWGDISSRWNVDEVPENQRYFILVKAKEYAEPGAVQLMKALHDRVRSNNVAGEVCFREDQGWALGCAGLIRADRLLNGHPPIFGRRLRPIAERFDHLLEGSLDIALREHSDRTPETVHGVKSVGNLLTSHDAGHGVIAVKETIPRRELLILGKNVYCQLLKNKVVPPYSKNVKSIADPGIFYELLTVRPNRDGHNTPPTQEDWIRFFLHEAIIAIQDGEAQYQSFASEEDFDIGEEGPVEKSPVQILEDTIQFMCERQNLYYRSQPSAVEPPHLQELVPKLKQYLRSIDPQFF